MHCHACHIIQIQRKKKFKNFAYSKLYTLYYGLTMCFIMVGCKYIADIYPVQFVKTAHPLSVGLVIVGTAFFLLVEMFLIVPMIFDTGGVLYKLAWLVAIFIVYNLLGNMVACYRTDSSVASLPRDRQIPDPEEEHLWHHCDYCQMLVPPRSWHCRLCNCCILRRDHHCIFTATCIGHNNYSIFDDRNIFGPGNACTPVHS
nr:probable protein S-acyltransferase 16 isoform X2 [Drosophila suzukii]